MEEKGDTIKTVVMDDNGRVTISKKFREQYKLTSGDKIQITEYDGNIILTKQTAKPSTLSFEYLYNKIMLLEQTKIEDHKKFEELRRMVIEEVIRKEDE